MPSAAREGFVVVTGDIGTGKTTLCRALLEQIDRTTFTALVLNPFLSEEDLLKRILQDFGVISRDEMKARAAGAASRKQELIETLYDFLLVADPAQGAARVLIIDEAQNLPLPVLEQIRILSNLETDKEKLLQIILVGQLNLQTLLRSPELRQLDQRVSIRYELKPLDRGSRRRLRRAPADDRRRRGGGQLHGRRRCTQVHRLVGRHPAPHQPDLRSCACSPAFSVRANRITPEMVDARGRQPRRADAARRPRCDWFSAAGVRPSRPRAVVLLSCGARGRRVGAIVYQRFAAGVGARGRRVPPNGGAPRGATRGAPVARTAAGQVSSRELPADAAFTILVGSFPSAATTTAPNVASTTDWLEASGFRVFYAEVDLGPRGRWQRVLAGAYTDLAGGASRRGAAEGRRAAERRAPGERVAYAIGLVAGRRASLTPSSARRAPNREPDPRRAPPPFRRSRRRRRVARRGPPRRRRCSPRSATRRPAQVARACRSRPLSVVRRGAVL